MSDTRVLGPAVMTKPNSTPYPIPSHPIPSHPITRQNINHTVPGARPGGNQDMYTPTLFVALFVADEISWRRRNVSPRMECGVCLRARVCVIHLIHTN